MQNLNDKLELLTSSPLLQAEQKFSVVNTSICPTLVYLFQTVPLHLIPKKFLEDAKKKY